MMNYIWALMILVGIVVAACTGRMEEVSTGILDSSKEAISLCIVMLGVIGMWTGIMKIAEKTGLVRQLTKLLLPVLRLLFPHIVEEEEVMGYIATNLIANLLGLGWAATPSGIKAMKALKEIHIRRCEGAVRKHCENVTVAGKPERKDRWEIDSASDEMCMLMVINISSLQLIPINMIAYRMQYGSAHPGAILVPGLIATGVSTLVGVGYGILHSRNHRS